MPQMARVGQGARIKRAHAEQRERELSKQRVTVRCAHCTGKGNHGRIGRPFQFTGPVHEAQQRFAEHRARAHPELPTLEAKAKAQRRLQRQVPGVSRTRGGYHARREFLDPDELREREVLRRETRSDLLPLDAEEAAA